MSKRQTSELTRVNNVVLLQWEIHGLTFNTFSLLESSCLQLLPVHSSREVSHLSMPDN